MKTSLWVMALLVLVLLVVVAALAWLCIKIFDGWDALTRRGRARAAGGRGAAGGETKLRDSES